MTTGPAQRVPARSPDILRARARALFSHVSVRGAGVLMLGSFVAQGLAALAMPALGRLFDPADFGVLGLVQALALPLVAVAALRYDVAILLPEREEDAARVTALALLSSLATGLLTLGAVALLRRPLAEWLGSPSLADWLWVCPAFVAVGGAHSAWSFWATRCARFGGLAGASASGSVATVAAQIGAGLLRTGAAGLVLGQLFGRLLGWAALVVSSPRPRPGRITPSALRRAASGYEDFPRWQVPAALLNHLTQHLPTYALGAVFGEAAVGQWALAAMLLSVPTLLVSGAIRQVLLQRFGELRRAGESLWPLARRVTLGLAVVGIPMAAVAALAAPSAFEWALGETWRPAGRLAQPIVLWQLTALVNAPVAAAYPVLRLNRLIFGWQLVTVVGTGAAVTLGARLDPTATVDAFCAATGAANLAILALVLRASALKGRDRGEAG